MVEKVRLFNWGGALAEATGKLFRVSQKDRWLLIICGISGGFSAVFGTPVAGAIFSFEVLKRAKFKGTSFVVSLLTALIANQVATLAGATHSLYQLGEVPKTTLPVFGYVLVFSVIFGLVSRSFAFSVSFIKKLYQKLIVNEVLRIGFGACLVLLLAGCYGTSRYLGLSLPILSDAFQGSQPTFDFLNKFIFTVLSLGAGFQGGEVTPLFEIGASLGSLLGQLSQLPVGFVAGLGFVSVFAGATKTPVASFFMALELFGVTAAGWFLLGSFISVLASGKKGIYESQLRGIS
ncbi:chloride channel protein [Vagococcus salmoninarum]|uniref:chloride channel protein n=1 Tax=Vagococcus salmoninarum TaxID=2739 RepID=UPI003F946166